MKSNKSDRSDATPNGQIIDTEILIVGGGAAGCFAAFGADEAGVKVLIVEKAGIQRSGNLATGVDDCQFAHSEITCSEKYFVQRILESAEGMCDPNLAEVLAHECYDRFLDLERIGVKMRDEDGGLHRFPKRHPASIWFRGADLKLRMTQEIQRRRIPVLEHTICTKLFAASGRICGAFCYNIRTGLGTVVRAKAVILTTGGASRLYSMEGGSFLVQSCPACSGDGIALAYHAGARLTGMEFKSVRVAASNPRIIPALGTLIDAEVPVVDAEGHAVTKTGHKAHALGEIFIDREKNGEGPIYWDFPAISENGREHFINSALNERPICLKNLKEGGIDFTTDRIEIARLEQEGIAPHLGGVLIDKDCQTSVEGLYAAGDTAALAGTKGNSALSAMTLGHRAGRFAAQYSRKTKQLELNPESIEDEKRRITNDSNRKSGLKPVELEKKVHDLMTKYCSIEKSGEKLQAGLARLKSLRDRHLNNVAAETNHEIMRFIELNNVFDVAEMHLRASIMRQESRLGLMHRRVDYPDQDDLNWRKMIVIRKLGENQMEMIVEDLPQAKDH